MKVFTAEECPQGSAEWFAVRKGIPTASRFDRILTPKTLKLSGQIDGLIAELIGEAASIIPPEGVENYTNRAMRWGTQCEAEARSWYSLETNEDVQQVGFITTDDGRFGASPDGLVGEHGGLELKCPQATQHVAWLLDGVLPADHKAQVHGNLIVSGREWWDFLSYSPMKPPVPSVFRVRVFPDDYTATLADALEQFYKRFDEALARVAAMTKEESRDHS